MTSKRVRVFLKYFYYANILSGFVIVNVIENRASFSPLRAIYAFLWMAFFVKNYFRAVYASYNGFEEIYQQDHKMSTTSIIEIDVTYAAIVFIALLMVKSYKPGAQLFSTLLRLKDLDGFSYKPSVNLISTAVFGELISCFLFFINLFWFAWDGWKQMINLNPLNNSFLNCCLILTPVTIVSRFSVFLAFLIDFFRNLVVLMNQQLKKALQLAEQPENHQELKQKLEEINQFYSLILKSIKLFENSFGIIVLVLQILCMLVTCNQVRSNKVEVSIRSLI